MNQNKLFMPHLYSTKESKTSFAEVLSAFLLNETFKSRWKTVFSALLFCFCFGIAGIVQAQTPGSLDATFGTGGKTITPIGSANDGISGVVVQTDGKIVVAGYSDNGSNTDFALARYNADGTLDTTFGTGGKTVTPIGSGNDFASALAIQSDGKIVAVGYASNGSNLDFGLARYNSNGTLDTTFGTNGKTITPIGNSDDFASALAIQADGKIIVVGATDVSVNVGDFALVRYNTDGTLDTTFGTGGKTVTPIGISDDFASAVKIQTDGKIVVAGSASDGTTNDFALARYNTNGTLDTTFGAGGKTVTPVGNSEDFASSVLLQSDGKIIVAGDSNNGSDADFALVRFTAGGALDTTFGTNGKTITPIGSQNDFLYAAAIQSDGKIVAVGYSTGATDDFALARYNADGTLDTTFGTGGKVITPIGSSTDTATSVAIQSDGKIVAAGYASNGTNFDFALARYFGTNPNNPVPAITSISPNNALAGSAAFELTVNGSNFVNGSVVRFNGQDRVTTFVSSTQLKAQILASDVQTAGQFPVTVFNPTPGGGVSNAVTFTVGACTYSLNPTSQSFNAGGGNSTFTLTTQAGCAYTVVNNAPSFITVTSATSGTGSATISFTVAANNGPARTGTITVGGQTFTVLQGDGCVYGITPSSANFAAAGGTGSFTVAVSNTGCTYTATSNSSFITVNNGTGTGSGTVTFTVAANSGADRTGTITVNGQTFTVMQSGGCSYVLSPATANFGSNGGTGSFTVTTGTGCTFTATSNASFITINNGTGTGSGTVTFTVAANTGADRTGTITVNGQTFTVTQSGGCSYVLSPTNANFTAAGGTGSFTVTSGAGCTYTATSNSSFVTVNNGTGTGSGTVTLTVAANVGASRTGTITVNGQTFTVNQSAGTSAPRTAFDFDGDGKADISVFRPENGIWYLLNSQTGFTGAQFGVSTDRIVPADYDGDGKTDLGVYRDGAWYLQRSTAGFAGISFGAATDIPMPADFDGDGKAELAVFRPSNGTWYIYNLTTNQVSGVQFGASEDKPAAADYDGDGKADVAVFRPSTGIWYIQRSTAGFTGIQFGDANDKTVAADYDGDGKADVAVFRPSTGTWYLQRSSAGFTGIQFGLGTDLPTPADYDGDGKTDVAVFREGAWYIQRSTAGFTGVGFGAATDKPVPNAFVR